MTNKRRKAELTSGQIVSIIILAISFIIILFILYKAYNWNPLIDRETCHESIVYRSSVNWGLIKTSNMVPLKCQTEKVCLTMGGKECTQVGKNSPNNPVTTVKLDKDIISARQQVMDKIAEGMYDCHSMLGEGQLGFMPEKGYPKKYCLICARFVLDEEARQKIEDIRYTELYQDLWKKVAPNKKTYLEYLHPDWKDWRSIWNLFLELKKNIKDDGILGAEQKSITRSDYTIEDWKINLEDENGFVIVAQTEPAGYWQSFALAGGTAIGAGALAATGFGAPVAVTLLAAGGAGATTFWYSSPTGDFEYSPPHIEPYSLERLQSLNCDSFETAP